MSNSIIFIFSQYKYCGIRYKNLPPHSPIPPGCLTAGFMHYLLIRVQRETTAVRPALLSELLFNPQKLVIFRHAIGTARRSGFNLSGIYRYCNIGYEGILRLARTVGNHCGISRFFRHLYGIKALCQRTYLVYFDKDRVGHALFDSSAEPLGICNEEIVSHQLNLLTEFIRQPFPALPVIFLEAVLDGTDGELPISLL